MCVFRREEEEYKEEEEWEEEEHSDPRHGIGGGHGSDDVEALGVIDGLEELLLELLLVFVLGRQQMVEARVRRWQPRLVGAVSRDDKVEIAQALDRHAIGAGAEE